jgi:hypothetical protein
MNYLMLHDESNAAKKRKMMSISVLFSFFSVCAINEMSMDVHFLFCLLGTYVHFSYFILSFLKKNNLLLCSNTYVQILLLTSRVEALYTGSELNHMQLFVFLFFL